MTHFVFVIYFCAQYLDENKQLILAILDNQNLGKLNECATYASYVSSLLLLYATFTIHAVATTGSIEVHAFLFCLLRLLFLVFNLE